jgi:Spy/CpxP family protein refolding chaperone
VRKLAAILSLVVAAVLALPAAGQMPEAPPGKWWKRPVIARLLNLSPEQQSKLEDIFAKRRREFVDLKADVERRQIDVDELIAKKDSDSKKVAASVDALEQSRLRLRKAATMMFLEQKDVLTAAQWQQILDRRDEWHRERRQRLAPRPPEQRPVEPPPDR